MVDHPLSSEPSAQNSTSSPSPNSGTISHRSSFAENLRQSPRSARHPSLTQSAVQDLLSHPPTSKPDDPKFAGRDWRQICVGELVRPNEVRWAELDCKVEQASELLIAAGPPNVILLRESPDQTTACGTFDYTDLNAYLLVVVGLATPQEDELKEYDSLAKKAREGIPIPLRDVQKLAKKAPLITLSETADLSKAIESFASGVHRILVCRQGTTEVIGILSQLRLVRFLWENGSRFPVIDALYPMVLKDLAIGTPQTIAINGDRNLAEALQLMSEEGLSSVAVVDNALNVVGNISTVDTKLLTKSSSLPLLKGSCIHFISVILSERGIGDGKDSFPVFHVTPNATLAHVVAKLVATRSHRMWVVEAASPSPSIPSTPVAVHSTTHPILTSPTNSVPSSPALSGAFPAVSATSLPGARISGRLTGVVSLTDILNLFARQSGLNPLSPGDQRSQRRSSNSSLKRPSIDSTRGSSIDIRR